MVWLDDHEQRAWRAFLRLRSGLTLALAQSLQAETGMSEPDYEILAALSESQHGRLRARALRCTLGWEKSRLAHQVRRMEQRGLLTRAPCPEDARSSEILITAAGRRLITAAAPAHAARVKAWFADALTREQLDQLILITEALERRLPAPPED